MGSRLLGADIGPGLFNFDIFFSMKSSDKQNFRESATELPRLIIVSFLKCLTISYRFSGFR